MRGGVKEMAVEYILLSHGMLSSGMKDTVEMIIGETKNLHSIGMDPDTGTDKLIQDVKNLMAEHSGAKFVLLTDLFGGSVNNRVYEQFQSDPNVEIVAGMNLSLVLEMVLQPEAGRESCLSAIDLARENMVYMRDMVFESEDDE